MYTLGISLVCFYVVDILYISIEHHIYIIETSRFLEMQIIFHLTNKHVDEQSCAVLPFPDLSLIFPKSTRWLLLVGCLKIYIFQHPDKRGSRGRNNLYLSICKIYIKALVFKRVLITTPCKMTPEATSPSAI